MLNENDLFLQLSPHLNTPYPMVFQVDPAKGPAIRLRQVFWTIEAKTALAEILREAGKSGDPSGKALPFSSLRALLQVKLPTANFIADDLGAPWKQPDKESLYPFMEVDADIDPKDILHQCVKLWMVNQLSGWAEKLEIPDQAVDALDDCLDNDVLVTSKIVDAPRDVTAVLQGSAFGTMASGILQEASRRLTGMTLFEGLGPLYRTIRRNQKSSRLELLTWPVAVEGKKAALYSMRLRLSVETMPYSPLPVVTMRVSRIRWIARPITYAMSRMRTGYLMKKGEKAAVLFGIPSKDRKLQQPDDLLFLSTALSWDISTKVDPESMAHTELPRGDHFVGIAYAPSGGDSHPLGSGATDADHLDAYRALSETLGDLGWKAVAFRSIKYQAARKTDDYYLIGLKEQLADYARDIGRNDTDNDTLKAVSTGFLQLVSLEIPDKDLETDKDRLTGLRERNGDNIRRAFADEMPSVVVIASTEESRGRLRNSIKRLFGTSVTLHEYPLPANTHGPASKLRHADGRQMSPTERFGRRVAAWRDLAAIIKGKHPEAHVLVEAARFFKNGIDDPVAKAAGRYAIAKFAAANIQYILPLQVAGADAGPNIAAVKSFLIRTQMAMYDLLYGHSGLVLNVKEAVDYAFRDAANRPKSIIGISVISQARSRKMGGGSGQLCVATMLDLENGRAYGKVATHQAGGPGWTEDWKSFHTLLKIITDMPLPTIGQDQEQAKDTFQRFVQHVLDEAQDDGGALVMIDSTSSRGLWPWLNDNEIGKGMHFGTNRVDVSANWPDVRVVRIRTANAAPIVRERTASYKRIDVNTKEAVDSVVKLGHATMSVQIAEMASSGTSGAHYWSTSSFSTQSQMKRGTSVYRDRMLLSKPSDAVRDRLKENESLDIASVKAMSAWPPFVDDYRLPSTIEITITKASPADNYDLIACLIQHLRQGYAHTNDDTTLPAPLFFESKVRDYMVRFAIADAESDETDDTAPWPSDDGPGGGPNDDSDGGGGKIEAERDAEALNVVDSMFDDVAEQQELVPAPKRAHDRSALFSSAITSFSGAASPLASPTPHNDDAADDVEDIDLRQPLLPLPSHMTADHLRKCLRLSNSTKRILHHKFKDFIREFSGFSGWPSNIPTEDQLVDLVLSGLRYPLFFAAFNNRCVAATTSQKSLPMRPLFDGLFRESATFVNSAERATVKYHWQLLKYAAMRGNAKQQAMARDICLFTALGWGLDTDLDADVTQYSDICAAIMPTIQFMRRYKLTDTYIAAATAYDSYKANGSILPKTADATKVEEAAERSEHGPADANQVPGVGTPSPMELPVVSESQTNPSSVQAEDGGAAEIGADAIHEALSIAIDGRSPDDSSTWQALWKELLSKLQERARALASDEPSAEGIDNIRSLIDGLAEAARKYKAAKPTVVGIATYREFVRVIEGLLKESLAVVGSEAPLDVADIDRVRLGLEALEQIEAITPEAAAEADLLNVYFNDARTKLHRLQAEIKAIHGKHVEEGDNSLASMMSLANKMVPIQKSAVDLVSDGYFHLAEYLDCVVKGDVSAAAAPISKDAQEAAARAETADSVAGSQGTLEASAEEPAPQQEAAGGDTDSMADDIEVDVDEGSLPARTDELVSALDDALRAAESAAQAKDQAIHSEPEPEKLADPFVEQISAKLRELAIARQYGVAHHLARAAEKFMPDAEFAYTSSEMKLAAISGRVNFASGQHSKMLVGLVGDVLPVTRAECEDADLNHAIARRLIIIGSALEMALLDVSTGALQLLDTAISPDVNRQAHLLKERLAELTFQNAQANLDLFKNLSVVNQLRASDTALLKDVRDKAKGMETLTVRFAPARAVVKHLAMRDKPVGQLIVGLDTPGKEVAACQAFYDQLGEREQAYQLIGRTESEIHSKSTTIDGIARERVISHILELSGRCKVVIDRAKAAQLLNSDSYRSKMLGLVDRSLQQIKQMDAAIAVLAADSKPLEVQAAAHFARSQLERLAEIIRGQSKSVDNMAHLYAIHGPIMCVDGLRFGTSWLPSPYDPQQIVTAILQHKIYPSPNFEFLTQEAFEASARRHMVNWGLLAARRLVMLAKHSPVISPNAISEISNLIEAQISSIRNAVVSQLEGTKRMLENIERQADKLIEQEAASEQLTKLEHLDIASLPVGLTELDELTEDETGDLVSDFADVKAMLVDVKKRASNITAGKRGELHAALASLVKEGGVTDADALTIRNLIDADDVVTSQEYLEYVKKGEAIPTGPEETKRFAEFFPHAPQSLGGDLKSSRILASITNGVDFGGIAFSRVPENRREENAAIWTAWQELRNKTTGGSGTEVIDLLAKFLNKAEYRASVKESKSRPDGARFRGVLAMPLPVTADTNILPDFGSELRERYTVAVTNKRPSEADVTAFMSNANQQGRILFVTDTIPVADRTKLAGWCRNQQFKLLVIDDAVVAYLLSEEQYRPMTMMELAQPFAYASPYRDYTDLPVPPEMFYGRAAEIRSLVEPMGSCVVYGGRRLGKSALLKQIVGLYHDPKERFICAQVNIYSVGKNAPINDLWRLASGAMPDVFDRIKVPTADKFFDTITAWMDKYPASRILLMLDETEGLIHADAKADYTTFLKFSGLMTATNRRFKVVFAGLKNVTRLVRSGNPPLRHIASNPIQIGPLMEKELSEAERLVTRPLAALGFQFEERGLVWRILSKANYYPIMVQVFCENLLKLMRKRQVQKGEPPFIITAEHVHNAMADDALNRAIEMKFDETLTGVTHIYKLIACLIAERIYQNRAEGKVDDGMSAVEIRRGAVKYSPATANIADGLAVIEDLLDEMQGMGVIRRTTSGNWTLRSPSISRHLKDWDAIQQYLADYSKNHDVEDYDPRRLRRGLKPGGSLDVAEGYPAPLTHGQEFQLIDNPERVTVLFGSKASDIELVVPSLQIDNYPGGPETLISDVSTGQLDAMKAQISKLTRVKTHARRVLLVTPKSSWNSQWVKEALRLNAVRNDEVRVVFIGTDKHAARWVKEKGKLPTQHIREMSLSAWSHGMLNEMGQRVDISVDRYRNVIMGASGGLNHFMADVIRSLRGSGDRDTSTAKWSESILGDQGNLDKIGAFGDILKHFREILAYEVDVVTQDDIHAAAFTDHENSLTVEEFIRYGELMNLLMPEVPAKDEPASGLTKWRINPLLVALVKKHKAA
jgi:hypothetical protein